MQLFAFTACNKPDFRPKPFLISHNVIRLQWVSLPLTLKLPLPIDILDIQGIDIILRVNLDFGFSSFDFRVLMYLFPHVFGIWTWFCAFDIVDVYPISYKFRRSEFPFLKLRILVLRVQRIGWNPVGFEFYSLWFRSR